MPSPLANLTEHGTQHQIDYVSIFLQKIKSKVRKHLLEEIRAQKAEDRGKTS